MSRRHNYIQALIKLGQFLSQFSSAQEKNDSGILYNDLFYDTFKNQIRLAVEHNSWFTYDHIYFAIEQWCTLFNKESLENWLSPYHAIEQNSTKTVAIVMAGNIPLVGFHDLLCALVCNHSVLVKQSSNDTYLMPIIVKYLEAVAPELKNRIRFTKDKLTGFDAVIATGSNNTARYFEYYFGKKPNIIRKNRNSVAVLSGNETREELENLGEDIFRYYGLGCRSVSKLFVPEHYNFDLFFNAIYKYHHVMDTAKYANNYDYNKAVYLMSQFQLLENGFLILKEDSGYGSPIGTLFYETYRNNSELKQHIAKNEDSIQCVVARDFSERDIPFGKTQHPSLEDYADNVNTIEFLLKI